MTAGNDARIKGIGNGGQIIFHTLFSGHAHFFENMIVRTADQNTRFLDAQILDQLEILLTCTDPGCDFRELQVQLHTFFKSLPILLAVNKELRLTNDTVGTAQLIQELVDVDDLIHSIRLNGLHTVTQRGVGDPDFFGHIHGHPPVIEGNFRNGAVGIDIPLKVRFCHILQGVFVGFLFQKIRTIGNFQHMKFSFLMFPCFYVYNYTLIHSTVNEKIPSDRPGGERLDIITKNNQT